MRRSSCAGCSVTVVFSTEEEKRIMSTNQKIFIVCPDVLMRHPPSIEKLSSGGNVCILAGPTHQILANYMRCDHEHLRRYANAAVSFIDRYRNSTSKDGVRTKSGGTFRSEIRMAKPKRLQDCGLNKDDPDNQILLVAMRVIDEESSRPVSVRRQVIVVSGNPSIRQRAEHLGIRAEDYKADRVEDVKQALYGGTTRLDIEDPQVLNLLYRSKLHLPDLNGSVDPHKVEAMHENQCVILRLPDERNGLAIYKKSREFFQPVRPIKDYRSSDGIVPRNDMQALAMGVLDDPSIKIVTLVGSGGAGKTLLALNWALEHLSGFSAGPYDSVTVFRTNIEAGHELGYRPGDVSEKTRDLREAVDSVLRCLSKCRDDDGRRNKWDDGRRGRRDDRRYGVGNSISAYLEEMGLLSVKVPNFQRGANLSGVNIIDDAQNWELLLLQLIGSRHLEGSRLIITGDPTQIDNKMLNMSNCGLVRMIHAMRGSRLFATVYLPEVERGEIPAEIAERFPSSDEDFFF